MLYHLVDVRGTVLEICSLCNTCMSSNIRTFHPSSAFLGTLTSPRGHPSPIYLLGLYQTGGNNRGLGCVFTTSQLPIHADYIIISDNSLHSTLHNRRAHSADTILFRNKDELRHVCNPLVPMPARKLSPHSANRSVRHFTIPTAADQEMSSCL